MRVDRRITDDHYAALGVVKDASREDIDRSYRQKAKELHPDVNPDQDASDEFKKVAQAYEVLSDPRKRADYDLSLEAPFVPDMFAHDPIARQFFHAARRGRRQRPSDVVVNLEVTFLEAARGCEKTVVFHRTISCRKCGGTGAISWDKCAMCGGSGYVEMQQAPFSIRVGCGNCKGQGRIPKERCECKHGYVSAGPESHAVTIPPGVDNGMGVRFQGKGEDGGDLVVKVRVQPHEFFRREGSSLICEYPVSYSQILLGDTIEVPGIDARFSVKIPPGTSPGGSVRLREQGLLDVSRPGIHGDYFVVLRLEMPQEDEDYRAAVEGLRDMERRHLEPLLKKYE